VIVNFVTKNVTKVGRPRLKRKAMSATERQRRHRKKVAGRSRAEGGDELHETPGRAVHALLEAEVLPQVLWEPAAGYGAIARILRGAGRAVIASDLRAYPTPDLDFVADFLTTTEVPAGVQAVITNAPFTKSAAFVRHAFALGIPQVFLLQRLAWSESTGTDRADILEGGHLARVRIFRKRLPRMHRFGWNGPKASSPEGHAWYVFDVRHRGPPSLHWL
jgi:hypothetical protein